MVVRVKRWEKAGHERLYVRDGSIELGYYDVRRERAEVAVPAREGEFWAAVDAWRERSERGGARSAHSIPPLPATPLDSDDQVTPPALPAGRADWVEPAPTPRLTAPVWVDLAGNRPGQAAAQQASSVRTGGTVVTRLLGMRGRDTPWRAGVAGEKATAAVLGKLERHGWHVLHAVPFGRRGSDIDHVLIGPAGVYVINSKYHRNGRVAVTREAVLVNGYVSRYADAGRYVANRATRLLSAAVQRHVTAWPVVVIVGADTVAGWQDHHPHRVDVLPLDRLRRWLRSRATILDPETVELTYTAARRSDTWTS